jgi:hypothetical protein
MTDAEKKLLAEVEALRGENARLKASVGTPKANTLSVKVTEKGGVSVYGLQRWPVTLYPSQWLHLLGQSKAIMDFVHKGLNEGRLKMEKDAAVIEAKASASKPIALTARM